MVDLNFKFLFITAAFLLVSCTSGISDNNKSEDLSAEQELESAREEEEILESFFTEEDFPLEWKLESFSTMMVGSNTSGEDMPYQEKISFSREGVFKKTRKESGKVLEATGEYFPVTQNGERFYQLNYSSKNELIENCNGSLEEMFHILSGDKAQSTAQACDYPAKTYILNR